MPCTDSLNCPAAIREIAADFHLVGIGGTSAGAIAACAAAAAEYRRRHGGGLSGFDAMAQMPAQLGGGNLLQLFRPDAGTRKVFALLVATLKEKSWYQRIAWKARIGWSAIRHSALLQSLVENGFGVCTGMANGNPPPPGATPPLTEWLTRLIDEIAGRPLDGPPLTFGDLRSAPLPPPPLGDAMEGAAGRSIDLRCVTTCLSFGRPYELPLDDHQLFAFDPQEWRSLFPKRVVDHLVAAASGIESDGLKREGKLPLPTGDALPVVVAVRMSLSFPGLFAMVPLYAVDYQRDEQPLRKVWFSDGGITSNLPIHRFDALFPRWPTLGINLQYTGDDGQPGRRQSKEESDRGDDPYVHMIGRRADGARDLWHVFDDEPKARSNAIGFGMAIFRSAQVWHDHAFLRLPAYRDRIVEIWLGPAEGGMNLDMRAEAIEALARRGRLAGQKLCARFAAAPASDELSWEGHRWARLRSGVEALARYLQGFERTARHPLPGDAKLLDLFASLDTPPTLRFRSDSQREGAREALERLLRWIGSLEREKEPWSRDANHPFHDPPRPRADIGTRAPL
jgi:hypothetical protein